MHACKKIYLTKYFTVDWSSYCQAITRLGTNICNLQLSGRKRKNKGNDYTGTESIEAMQQKHKTYQDIMPISLSMELKHHMTEIHVHGRASLLHHAISQQQRQARHMRIIYDLEMGTDTTFCKTK